MIFFLSLPFFLPVGPVRVEKHVVHSDSTDDRPGHRRQFLVAARNSRHPQKPLRGKTLPKKYANRQFSLSPSLLYPSPPPLPSPTFPPGQIVT